MIPFNHGWGSLQSHSWLLQRFLSYCIWRISVWVRDSFWSWQRFASLSFGSLLLNSVNLLGHDQGVLLFLFKESVFGHWCLSVMTKVHSCCVQRVIVWASDSFLSWPRLTTLSLNESVSSQWFFLVSNEILSYCTQTIPCLNQWIITVMTKIQFLLIQYLNQYLPQCFVQWILSAMTEILFSLIQRIRDWVKIFSFMTVIHFHYVQRISLWVSVWILLVMTNWDKRISGRFIESFRSWLFKEFLHYYS